MIRTKSRVLLAAVVNGLLVTSSPAWMPLLVGTSNGTTVTPDPGWRLSLEYAVAAAFGMPVCLATLAGAERYLSGQMRFRSAAFVLLIPSAIVVVLLGLHPSPAPATYIASYALL